MLAFAWCLALAWVLGCASQRTLRRPPPPPRASIVHPVFDADAAANGESGVVPPGPLAVRDVRPEGPSDGLGIRLRLDRAILDPDSDVELVLDRIDAAGARHRVAATSLWTRADTLELLPTDDLPDATAFEARLVGRIEDERGHHVEGTTWRFETRRPTLERVETWEELHGTKPIWILPSSAIDPRELAANLRARAAARDIRVDVRRATSSEIDEGMDEDALAIVPRRAWPAGAVLDVGVDAALVGQAGPLAMGTPWRTRIEVRPSLSIGALRCEGVEGHVCPLGAVTIATSTRLAEDSLDRIRVEPKLADMHVSLDFSDEPGIMIDGDWQSDQEYRVVFDRRIVDEHGTKLGRTKRVAVRVSDTLGPDDAMIELSSVSGIFTSPKAAKIAVRSRRVGAIDVRIRAVRASEVPTLVDLAGLARVKWPATTRDVSTHHELPAKSRWNERIVIDVGENAELGDVVLVEATARDIAPHTKAPEATTVVGLFRISALGVVAHRGPRHGFVRVTAVDDGSPIAGADVQLFADGKAQPRLETDRHGLVRIEGAGDEKKPPVVLVTREGDALAMRLAMQPAAHEDDRRHGWITAKGVLAVEPRSHRTGRRSGPLRAGELPSLVIYSGRGVYQEDDPVNVAGWASISTPHAVTSTRRVPSGTKVVLALRRDRSNVATKTVRIDEHGRFHGTLRVPTAARLGRWEIAATLLGATTEASIIVAEVRIPTFEVELDAGPGEILRGTEIAATASARYLSGEAATIGVAQSSLSCHPASPPDLVELPAGFSAQNDTRVPAEYSGGEGERKHATATWRFPTADLDPRTSWSCGLSVAIADRGLQEVGADDSVHVHAANVHLALRELRPRAGKRAVIEAIAVDHRGRRVALEGVEIELDREGKSGGREARCRVDIAAAGPPARCRTSVLREGNHRIVAHGMEGENLVHIEREVWVDPPPVRVADVPAPIVAPTPEPPRERPFEVRVAEDLPAGKRAKVEITAPWDSGKGVLAVEQIGLRETIPFELVGGRATVDVVPSANLGPAIELVARVARGAENGGLAKEHVAQTSSGVSRDRSLRVQITARASATIGERVPIRVDVHDQGSPVDARVALWVVDVGLDELRPSHPPSMLALDRDRRRERSVASSYDSLNDPYPSLFYGRSKRAPQVRMAHANAKGGLGGPSLRRRFDSAPLFVGNVGTGKDGHVSVDLDLPDDLTRFRITAVASAPLADHPESGPARFGDDRAFITTTTPLAVRAAMPRSLRPGDETMVAALVTVPRDGEVDVTLELPDDALRSIGAVRKRVRGTRGSIARVTFAVKAHAIGEPRLRVRATLREDGRRKRVRSGAVEQTIAIERERTQTERVALYGSVDDDRVHAMPIRLPRKAVPKSGTVEVTTTANLLGDFDEAARYLSDYPHGCIEQSASRLVPIVGAASLGDRSPDPARARESAAAYVGYILSMQLDDGSFGYWPGATRSAGFAGGYALWILQLAERRGFDVPADALARARAALAKHVRAGDPTDATTAPEHPQDAEQWLTHVMILHALADANEVQATDFDLAYAHRGDLPISARALLVMAMHRVNPQDARVATLRRGLDALVEQRAAVAHFVAPEGSARGWWDSAARDDAIGLMAMLQLAPDDPIADKLAAGLVSRRERGRWRTTQENAFALLALAEYASKREADAPDHRVRAWIADRPVLDAAVTTRDDVRRGGTAPLDAVRDASGTAAVTLARKGSGRVHWRVGVEWTEADPPARAQGLRLATRILDEHDVEVTRMEVGRRYRIEIRLASPTPQQYIAVDVPLPGGVDPIDRSLGHGLAARAASMVDSIRLSHLELRSDRATLFFDDLDPGTTVQQVAVLATAAGTYALPGAVAEAMYEPETFARTRATRIEIDPQTR